MPTKERVGVLVMYIPFGKLVEVCNDVNLLINLALLSPRNSNG